MLRRGNAKRAEFALPGSFYRNHEDEERTGPQRSRSYMSRDINRERDFHRFGFQFAGVKYRLVNEVRP